MTQNLQRHLDFDLSLSIGFLNRSETKAVLNALIPDNVNFPKGMSMKMFARGKILVVEFIFKNIPIGTVSNTIDEVLEHIALSKKVIANP